MSDAILNVGQAAELLGVRPKTVRALAAGGIIPAVKVGKPWRFDAELLREWIREKSRENQRRSPPAAVNSIPCARRFEPDSLSERLDKLLADETEVT